MMNLVGSSDTKI